MTPERFRTLMLPITAFIAGRAVDRALADELNRDFPGDGEAVRDIEAACHSAIAAGWMCAHGDEGRRFGRVIEPSPETADLSVDVVDLIEIVGPLHRHPTGEVCLVMPVDAEARFDGKGRGWCIYGPNSAHRPTVKGGRALVLYLLPGGQIDFSGA
jgi:hypothetical protein